MAARTGLWPDRGTAVGAYAIAPSGERGSFADRLPLPIRGRARMSTALDAPHRSVHLPPSLLPRVVGIRDFFVCLFRAAIGAPYGFGRSAFVVMVNPGHPVPLHTPRNPQLHLANGCPRGSAHCSRAHVRGWGTHRHEGSRRGTPPV